MIKREIIKLIKKINISIDTDIRKKWNRSLPFADLIDDRWDRAARLGFGEGTSIYNNVLVLGNVHVGKNTWIGPNVILDGSGGSLIIGDHCAISAGVQIYTHNVVKRCTSLGKHPIEHSRTNIGNGVFVGPNTVISMGVSIGDKAVIGAMSFVNRNIPNNAKAWGTPALVQEKK